LRGKEKLDDAAREKEIYAILSDHEYLFLHFPDGYKPSTAPSFLKRVRAEIDFFLKDIRRAGKMLAAAKNL
jgi:hypothetical protein